MIINEILTTETKYIDNLNTILSIFLPAFEHVVAARNLRLLIPAQLEMLVESHQQIKNTLKQRMDRESDMYGCIGDIFSHLCENSNVSIAICSEASRHWAIPPSICKHSSLLTY